MRNAGLISELAAASADLNQLLAIAPARLADIEVAMEGHPPGRGFDAGAARTNLTFCEIHEKDRCPCGSGTTYATQSDPTGEAALRPDQADADRKRLVAIAKSLRAQADEALTIAAKYAKRSATSKEIQQTLDDNESSAPCSSCSRTHVSKGVARWEPAHRDGLCRWCYDWRRRSGSLPPVMTLERHHRGFRDRRPA